MKQTIYLVILVIALFSCKKETVKENTTETIVKSDNYKRIKYCIFLQNNKLDTILLHYNSDNTLKDFITTSDSTFNTIWIYESGGYLVKRLYSNSINSFLFNCKYNIENVVTTIYTPYDTLDINYTDGLLTSINTGHNGNDNFSWKNGNIVKKISSKDTLTYDYLNVKNNGFWKVLGFNLDHLFSMENFIGFKSGCEFNNLVKSIKNTKGQIKQDFDYEYDKDGYVSKLTSNSYGYNNTGVQSNKTQNIYYFGWY